MTVAMTKTSVTIPTADLAAARRIGVNVSAVVRDALRVRLREERLSEEIDGYAAAFADWDESGWDHLTGDSGDGPPPRPSGRKKQSR